MRAGSALLMSAALFAGAAQASFGQDLAAGTIAGTTGAQQSTTCAKPRLSGLPKHPKSTNATIRYKLTNLPQGGTYLIKAGRSEVGAGAAAASTVKGSFLLPNQGAKSKKIVVSAIVQQDNCENAPWKLEKKIRYEAVTAPAANPAPPPAAAVPAPAPAPKAAKPVPAPAPVKPVKPAKPVKVKPVKPVTQRLPSIGPPANQRAWLNPIDPGARMESSVAEPQLSRLERKTEKASSDNALLGLGIVFGIFSIAIIGGFRVFRKRDDTQFEEAMTEQLKHLEEGDPGLAHADEEPVAGPFAATPAPFSEEAAAAEAPAAQPVTPEHRAQVEQELQRLLNEAGLEAHLDGILADARSEAERHGVELDTDLMLQALCDEVNGAAKLSDSKRSELRSVFADIIAEEARHLPAHVERERVPTP